MPIFPAARFIIICQIHYFYLREGMALFYETIALCLRNYAAHSLVDLVHTNQSIRGLQDDIKDLSSLRRDHREHTKVDRLECRILETGFQNKDIILNKQ